MFSACFLTSEMNSFHFNLSAIKSLLLLIFARACNLFFPFHSFFHLYHFVWRLVYIFFPVFFTSFCGSIQNMMSVIILSCATNHIIAHIHFEMAFLCDEFELNWSEYKLIYEKLKIKT